MRCRCHSSCRKSRFSQFGAQIQGKRFSISNRSSSCASCRSVFCLRTRLLRIWAASPMRNSKWSSPSRRSNPRAVHWLPFPGIRFPLEHGGPGRTALLLRGAAAAARLNPHSHYPQTLFVGSPGDSHTYNQHVRLLSPEPFARISCVMGIFRHLSEALLGKAQKGGRRGV